MRFPSELRLRLIGLAGLLAVGLLVYLVFGGRLPFGGGYRMEAVVTTANQLKAGDPVRVAGVEVGEVRGVEPGPDDTSVVELELEERGRPVHDDATLKIRPRLFLEGGFYAELRPGSPSAPELPDGGRLPLAQTATPVQFSEVLSTLTADLRAALGATLDELARAAVRGGAQGLGDAMRPLGTVARDGAVVASALQGREARDAERLVRGSARVAGALARRDGELGSLVTGLRRTTDVLARRDAELSASIEEAGRALGAAPAGLRAVDAALPPVRDTLEALRPSLRRAPQVLRDGGATLDQLAAAVRAPELPRLLALAGSPVRQLPTLVSRVRTLLGLVTPVTDCVRDQALPVLLGTLQDGAHTTGRPVWQELLHAVTGLGAATTTIDGNGYNARVQAVGGEQTLTSAGVPGIGPLVGVVTDGKVGSRPVPLPRGTARPFRPDATCRDQPRVDLTARTQDFGQTTSARRLTRTPAAPRSLGETLRRARRAVGR